MKPHQRREKVKTDQFLAHLKVFASDQKSYLTFAIKRQLRPAVPPSWPSLEISRTSIA